MSNFWHIIETPSHKILQSSSGFQIQICPTMNRELCGKCYLSGVSKKWSDIKNNNIWNVTCFNWFSIEL